MKVVIRKRLTLRGFIAWDFATRQADFLRDMGEWVGGGRFNGSAGCLKTGPQYKDGTCRCDRARPVLAQHVKHSALRFAKIGSAPNC
jgi:hypothetical protein